MAQVEIEFTVEPFTAGDLGPHVHAAIAAARAAGFEPEIGPFGTSLRAEAQVGAAVISDIVAAAMAEGAARVSVTVTAIG
jgi:uncharacterized protein YqgV (UPF0045/DUF77 family)